MKYIFVVFTTLISSLAIAQEGIIRGKVIDDANGESLIGVTVLVKGTNTGSTTDLDGEFSIKVAPGTYDLQVSYVSYQTTTLQDVTVAANDVTVLDNIRLKESTMELQEVTVTAAALRDTEAALHTIKKKAPAMMDGISAEKMQLTGDATAVEAAKRVTGVSVEGGKYVYVRGLGDRYSKTTLDNIDIPGLDPDKNTIQMDIFPSSLIQNIVVSKNFTADMPADFTGGMLNIETKDFPEEKIFSLSVGTSYNPDMNMISDYLTYPGASTDFLGFDDGTRSLPEGARQEVLPRPFDEFSDQEVFQFVDKFNPQLEAVRQNNFLNYNANLTLGDQFSLGQTPKLGYIFSLSYRSEYRYFDDITFGEYQRDPQNDNIYNLRYANLQQGQLGERNVLIGALGGLAFKTQFTKLRLTAMRLQNAESRAGKFSIDNSEDAVGQSGFIAESDNLEYNQREITNLLLEGTHVFGNNWEVNWKLSPTLSSIVDPDIRKTAYTFQNESPVFNAGAGGNPTRIWRYLDQLNANGKLDITKSYKFNGADARFKFGVNYVYKDREYEILTYDQQFVGTTNWEEADPSLALADDNIYPKGNRGYFVSGNPDPNPNAYESNSNNFGAYISNEFDVFPDFKTIIGLRAENFVLRHTGRDQAFANGSEDGINLENEKVLESLDLFPTVNLIYNVTDPQNIRISYSRTIARPSFKEMSFAQILDPVSNRIFNGGLFPYSDWDGNLSETRINNMDLRWEYFLEAGQIFSVSAFYKSFNDPIEIVRIPAAQTSIEFQPRNVGDAEVFGAEFEFVKNFDFLSPSLRYFALNGNLTLVESIIDMTNTEFDARKGFEREGENIDNQRQMAGQAPYVINAGLTYNNFDNGIDAGLFYNVKGPTLEIVGVGLYPDVFTEPFHSLNFTFNYKLGANQNTSIDFGVSNILDDKLESFFQSYRAEPEVFNRRSPGRAFSLGISHNF